MAAPDLWNNQLMEAERRITWVLENPRISTWLKDALRAAVMCDPIDVMNDVEMLRELLRFRTEAIVQKALQPSDAGESNGSR